MIPATFHDLEDAHIFITGGGSGIGAALVSAFAAQGAKVAYLDLVQGPDVKAKHNPVFVKGDVTDTAALQDAIAAHGPLKALINNAANDLRMEASGVTEADWQAMVDVNFKHYFFASQAAAKQMVDGGSIINFSSTSYMIGSNGMAPYVASNAGILGLTRALAREWGPQGIRVNALAPGWVLTPKQLEKWATPESVETFRETLCLKQMLKPEDIPGTVLFLASDISKMMTAQTLVVDGGGTFTG